MELARLTGRAHEITQHCNVWAVRADASGIHWQSQALGKIEIDARVIQFRQAESLRRQYAVQPRRIDRPRRAVTLPGPARQFIKLLPIAFVPGRHYYRN